MRLYTQVCQHEKENDFLFPILINKYFNGKRVRWDCSSEVGSISKSRLFSHSSLPWYFSFCRWFLTEVDALPSVPSDPCGKARVHPWVTPSLESSCLSYLGWGWNVALFWWEDRPSIHIICLYKPGFLNTAGGKQESLPCPWSDSPSPRCFWGESPLMPGQGGVWLKSSPL